MFPLPPILPHLVHAFRRAAILKEERRIERPDNVIGLALGEVGRVQVVESLDLVHVVKQRHLLLLRLRNGGEAFFL
jgi:hypothetical protein